MKLVRKDASKYIADSWKRYLKYKIQLRDLESLVSAIFQGPRWGGKDERKRFYVNKI
jgi:hypothetical protein